MKKNLEARGTGGEPFSFGRDKIGFNDIFLDAFGRLRVSNPFTLFDSAHQYDASPLFWNTKVTGGATVVHLPLESAVRLNCGTARGDEAIYQTKQYIRYQPGKGQQVTVTGVLGTRITNVRQRIGYFDDNNGLFFQQNDQMAVVRRSSVSGQVTDEVVPQANWNIAKLDGSKGILLDPSNVQIFLIDFQWLGAGRARFGFFIGGKPVFCHEFEAANILKNVYMVTGNLPVRYEIENLGVPPRAPFMKAICTAVSSEGGFDKEKAVTHGANIGTTGISVTTRRPILSIRPKATFNSLVNRGTVVPINYNIVAVGSDPLFFELVYNGTLGGVAASWTSLDDSSLSELDKASTTITGGHILDSGYIGANNQERVGFLSDNVLQDLPLSNDIDGANPDILSLVCTSTGAAIVVYASLAVREFY